MATITGSGSGSDTIDVTGDVGTLNGAPQGSPITDINVSASDTTLTISNSTISGTLSQSNGTLNATISDTTIGTFDLDNQGATINMTNVSLTNGGSWGAANRTVNWDGGTLSGNITSGAGNDIVTLENVTITDNITIQGGNGSDVWTFDNATIGNNFSFDSGASDTIVNISGGTSFGSGASFDTGNGGSDQLNLPDGTVVTISGQGTFTIGVDTFPTGPNFNGSFVLPNGSGASFSAFESFNSTGAPVCFTEGTLILTPVGQIPVEELAVGDLVVTAAGEALAIRWIGQRDMTFRLSQSGHRPVQIKAGALGVGAPAQDLAVSPQHCLLFQGAEVARLFGVHQVFVRAKWLTSWPGVRVMQGKKRTGYVTFLLDRHEIVQANGTWSESFFPGPYALSMLGARQRHEIGIICPQLREDPDGGYGPRAARVLTRAEAERLRRALRQPAPGQTAALAPKDAPERQAHRLH